MEGEATVLASEPLHHLTVGDLARENRRNWPGALAVVDGTTRLTYPELDDRVNRLAQALLAAEVGQGDRILWLGRNSSRVLELLLAAAKVGAVLCPANWRSSAAELAFLVDDFRPAVIVYETHSLDERLPGARALTAHQEARWIAADDPGDAGYESWLAAHEPADPQLRVDPSSALLALYTAAFDGRPNAALLSHTAIVTHNLALALQRQIEPGFVYLTTGPLFHVGTMMFCTATFHLGGTNVFLATFDPERACALIEAERCQAATLFPQMIEELTAANRRLGHDLGSLRSAPGGGDWDAMVSPDRTPWDRALGGYGQTEVAGMLTYAGLGIGGAGTHGRPSPFAQVRIVDEDGEEVPAGEVGEIVARGPHVMSGYHARPELTRARQRGGWHHTGDLGRREADGTISFVGPKLRIIKSGGENIYAAEVEQALRTHPSVRDVAVIGVPDPVWGQSVRAVVVPADGADVDAETLAVHCRKLIASYKKPRSVVTVAEIPRRGFAVDYDVLDARHGGGGYPGGA